MIPDQTLSFARFACQFYECGVHILLSSVGPPLTHCVIRGTDGDHGLAAVHREGEVLVFDLGHKLTEAGMAPDGPQVAQD